MGGMAEHKSRQPDSRKANRAEYGRVLAVDIGIECDAEQWRREPEIRTKPDGMNRREWRKLCRENGWHTSEWREDPEKVRERWAYARDVSMDAAKRSYLREYHIK